MNYTRTSTITRQHGLLAGEWRAPVNFAAGRRGSIHDDERARELGFEGGPVSGLIHNEQFPPLALAAFGQRWFERGSYSFYYRTPTLDREPVRAFMRDPDERADNVQVEAWSENEAGARVAEGNIGVGEVAEPSALRRRLENRQAQGELRILKDAKPGQSLGEEVRHFPLEGQLARRGTMTEPLEWYFGESPWGGPIASSLALYRMMRAPLDSTGAQGVQIDGGIEVRFVDGPVFVDTDYVLTASTLAVGQSPKTEYLWFESSLRDAESDRVVAEKLMMCRWMKNSAPLCRDEFVGGRMD
jgi:hypothetical protein